MASWGFLFYQGDFEIFATLVFRYFIGGLVAWSLNGLVAWSLNGVVSWRLKRALFSDCVGSTMVGNIRQRRAGYVLLYHALRLLCLFLST